MGYDARMEKRSRKIRWWLNATVSLSFVCMTTAMPRCAMADGLVRFFHSGDGRIQLVNAKNGLSFDGAYRKGGQTYDAEALRSIRAVLNAPAGEPSADISLRLVEFLDFLGDHFKPGARIEVASGWRSPAYNKRLREAGRLAATASLHQYGMAADIKIEGVSSRRVWNYVRNLDFGGAGYYHGEFVHIDVGPARFWDETSSGVGSGISDDNKLIGLVTDSDIYRPGDPVVLRFIRMTRFPIGVAPGFVLERVQQDEPSDEEIRFNPASAAKAGDGACLYFANIEQMISFRWTLPENLLCGRYTIKASFCDRLWDAMPSEIKTPAFEIAAPTDTSAR